MEKKETWWDALRFGIILLAVIIPFRMFIAQPFIVHGASMDDTFHQSDYLIVDQLSYLLRDPVRGEVIVFKNPQNESQYFIKRIIGLPGEKVTVHNGEVSITTGSTTINLAQPYIGSESPRDAYEQLGDDEYFVMGDNRAVSWDSRYWGGLKRDEIRGRALLRLFPFNQINYLPGNYQYKN
jgi:signal peptidase I